MPDEPKPDSERFHRFTATTVHHLREPVRTFGVYAEMLAPQAETHLSADAARSIEFLRRAAAQMQKLLDGMAEFAFATDRTTRATRRIALDVPLRQALLRLKAEIKAADAKVSYAGLPEVCGDIDRLELVFGHLVGNALRYRKDRTPEVGISAKSDGDRWIIQVSDNGPGVDAEFREKIFEPYRRLHGSELPGNGLGLAVCREIVEGLGGEIWVESGLVGGAVFCFTLARLADAV